MEHLTHCANCAVQPLSGVLLLKDFIYFYVYVCFASMSAYCVHAVLNGARRGLWIPWDWIHRHVSVHVGPEN